MTFTTPKPPTQVPDPLKDDVGKHEESDFNQDVRDEEEEFDEDADDDDEE